MDHEAGQEDEGPEDLEEGMRLGCQVKIRKGKVTLSWKKVKAKGGKLKLVKPGNFAKSVFHLAGTIEIFETYESIDEALSSFITPIEDYAVNTQLKHKFN